MTYPIGDQRDQLAHVGWSVVQAGLVVGSGGNLSAREPDADTCWVTAAGTWLDRLERSSFAQVRLPDGAVLDGHPEPTSELPLHLATYRARPDVQVIVHLHPQMCVLLDALGQRTRLVTTDHRFYLGEVVSTPWRPPGSAELADVAGSAAAGGANCIILGHHGCSVLGTDVETAHKRAMNLEEAARLTYYALMLTGDPDSVPECPSSPGSTV